MSPHASHLVRSGTGFSLECIDNQPMRTLAEGNREVQKYLKCHWERCLLRVRISPILYKNAWAVNKLACFPAVSGSTLRTVAYSGLEWVKWALVFRIPALLRVAEFCTTKSIQIPFPDWRIPVNLVRRDHKIGGNGVVPGCQDSFGRVLTFRTIFSPVSVWHRNPSEINSAWNTICFRSREKYICMWISRNSSWPQNSMWPLIPVLQKFAC